MSKHNFKTVKIKDKYYVEVHERIKFFRTDEAYKGWGMITDVVSHADGKVMFKASIFDDTNRLRATGTAQEKEDDGFINKTSYVENAETSAWGRALANLGIGIDTSIASSNEVENAILQQGSPTAIKKMPVTDDLKKRMETAIESGKADDVSKTLSKFSDSPNKKAIQKLIKELDLEVQNDK